jgi:magnesium-transporting ATPase (P-type)
MEESPSFRHIPIIALKAELGDFIDEQLKPNAIRTTKYTLLNWLPKSMLEQFRRVANAYFLGISALMILGTYATYLFISPLDPFSTIATLIIILLITSCKEGYEDLLRRRSDKYENNREVTVVSFEKDERGVVTVKETVKRSKRLRPGEIVKLSGTMPAPADLVIILTSMHNDGNKCYIETANIDGETNLKLREAPPAMSTELHNFVTEGLPVPELFSGSVHIEPPNANIHKVVGTLHLTAAEHPIPVDAQNIVLRSAVFSNTDWAYGVVVYAGQETKIQMNSLHAPSKMSKLEQNLNTAIIIIFVAQVVLVSVSVACVYLLGFDDTSKLPYVYPPGSSRGSVLPLWLELWLVFFLLYNNFIPLSLYVTIEIVNVGQSMLIGADQLMYHAELDVPCTVRASNLVQELGMVSNVFTDKTGTLTRNEMRLVKFVLDGQIHSIAPPPSPPSPGARAGALHTSDSAADLQQGSPHSHSSPESAPSTRPSTGGSASHDDNTGAAHGNGDVAAAVNVDKPLIVSAGTPQSGPHRRIRLPRTDSDSSDSSDSEPRASRKKIRDTSAHTDPCTITLSVPATPHATAASTAPGSPDPAQLFAFLRALMTCHTVVRESNGTYRAESPDELALVQGASDHYDCCLLERGSREMRLRIAGRDCRYAIVAVNPFNADRKRMSILLRIVEEVGADEGAGADHGRGQDQSQERYLVVCKGADNIMLPLCKDGESPALDKALLHLANQGLRTLVIAQRLLSADEAKRWVARHRASMVATANREEQVAQAGAELERDLEVVGATAIEDRLQDEVPEVIADLTRAGIIVWMLTGDKLETAVNIGRSCNLLQPRSQMVSIANVHSKEEFAAALRAAHDTVQEATAASAAGGGSGAGGEGSRAPSPSGKSRRSSSVARGEAGSVVLILEGPSFSFFSAENEEQRTQLLAIGRHCQSVIACRLTPMQKRELVSLTKNDPQAHPKATTLSIGDGANDVSMILEANVSVGIFGKEGRQAANNADFAIGEFKFLRRLLLIHGRYNYVRQSKVFLYSMHKNMVLTMTLFWFR